MGLYFQSGVIFNLITYLIVDAQEVAAAPNGCTLTPTGTARRASAARPRVTK